MTSPEQATIADLFRLMTEQGKTLSNLQDHATETASELRHMRSRLQTMETNAEALNEAWNGNNRRLDDLTKVIERIRSDRVGR